MPETADLSANGNAPGSWLPPDGFGDHQIEF